MSFSTKIPCLQISLSLIALSLFFASLANSVEEAKAQEINLPVPKLSQEVIIRYKTGARPYRTTGIRLEPEYWHNKLIIHDYGHGGSGISLSWGSACISLEILRQEMASGFKTKNQQAAILGSGIIGLTTALLLAEQGWQVQVYASQFPPHTTSNIAPGLWSKVVVGENLSESSKEQLERIMNLSFNYFQDLAENTDPEFTGVSSLDIYTFKPRSINKSLPEDIIAKGFPIQACFGNGPRKEGFYYCSLLVDTSLYIPQLVEKAQAKGVEFTQKTFQSKEELAGVSESIIFNCTGLGSRGLFGDADLIPVTGQLIELQPQEGLNCMLSGPYGNRCDLYIIPINNKLILGGSYQFNVEAAKPNVELCEEILEHARGYFNH